MHAHRSIIMASRTTIVLAIALWCATVAQGMPSLHDDDAGGGLHTELGAGAILYPGYIYTYMYRYEVKVILRRASTL